VNALHAVGPSLFCFVSLVVGVRLAALAVRTRAIPESMFAIAFVSAGSIGYGGAALGSLGITTIPLLGLPSVFVGVIGVGIGAAGVGAFTWVVFRHDSLVALTALVAGIALVATSILMQLFSGHGDVRDLNSPWFWAGFVPRSLAYAWSALEALRFYVRMRRREQLGLADRALTNRFLYWGIAATSAFLMHLPVPLDAAMGSVRPGMEPHSAIITSALGLTAAVTLWCTFFAGKRAPSPA
jgi:hypothetical protein